MGATSRPHAVPSGRGPGGDIGTPSERSGAGRAAGPRGVTRHGASFPADSGRKEHPNYAERMRLPSWTAASLPPGERLVGFDNAHPVAGQKRGEPQDHRHRLRTIRSYEYHDAATLLADFWSTVDAVLRERGVIP